MQYQQTAQGLQDLYNLPVAMAPQGLALMGQQQTADQMTQQDQARQLAFDTANDPLKLANSGLTNQTIQAQLPGHQASSSIRQRQNTIEEQTTPQHIQDILGNYSTADLTRHVTDAENAGTRMAQLGAEAWSNPLGARERIKAQLQKEGHGSMWNPNWDNPDMQPEEFAKQLSDYGTGMQDASAKVRAALQLKEMQARAAMYTADQRLEGVKLNAAQRAQAASALVEQKREAAATPKGLGDWAAKMAQLAATEEDPQLKAKYTKEAQDAFVKAKQMAEAAALVNTGPKVNTNALGIQNMEAGRGAPAITGAQGASAPEPSPAPQAAPAGWGAGAVQNADGSVTYNGVTYRKKQ